MWEARLGQRAGMRSYRLRVGLVLDNDGRVRDPLVVREVISTANAPSSPFYSQGVKAGGHLHVSGLVGIDMGTGNLAGSTIQEQTRQALTNCRAVLQAAGATMDDVVEVGVLLTNPADFAGMNEEYATWFPAEPPSRYVAKLGVEILGVLVSIRMTAFVG
jgi:2-iminobutanoate/2-iminopropanoate deaminase